MNKSTVELLNLAPVLTNFRIS